MRSRPRPRPDEGARLHLYAKIKLEASLPTIFVSVAIDKPFGPVALITYGQDQRPGITYDERYRDTENKLTAGTTLDEPVSKGRA